MSNGNNNGKPPHRPPGAPPPLPPGSRLGDVRPSDQAGQPRPRPGQPGGYGGRQPGGQVIGHAAPGHHHAPAPPRQRTAAQPAHRAAARQAEPRERSMFATVAIAAVAGLGILAAVAVAFLVIAPPVDLIRREAVAAVKRETGRDLVIRGDAGLTLYPNVGVRLGDVSLSAPPGMGGPPTVTMKQLDVAVKLMPLLQQRVEVKQLVLTRPVFDLRVDRNGRASWDFALARDRTAATRLAAATGTGPVTDAGAPHLVMAQAATAGRLPAATRQALGELSLDDVRIVSGTIDYADERDGTRHKLTSLDATVSAAKLTMPLRAKGDTDWQGKTVNFDATVTNLATLIDDKRAKLALEIKSRPLEANYTGSLDAANGIGLDGNVTASAPSLRALAQLAGHALPPNDGFGAFTLATRLKAQGDSLTLDNADVSLDGMRAVGRIAATLAKPRPQVKADLKIAELTIDPYFSGGGGAPASAAPASKAPAAQTPPGPAAPTAPPATAPQSIEDLLERGNGPRVKGYTARAGWSDERLDLAMLDLIDADARLSVGKLRVRDVSVGQSDVVLALKNRVARTTFERVQLYQGTGRGTITIDASGPSPALAANLVVDGVAAAPLLKDTASVDWMSGTGKVTLALTSSGATQRELVSALDGRAEIAFTDGAVTGFDVAKAVRGLSQGKLTGLNASAGDKTDFSQLSASFDIADGIATNQDLTLLSPALRVSGSGRILMPDRQLDLLIKPKIVADTTGQAGAIDLAGIEVPVKITGPWDRPQYTPDLSKIDAGQAVKAVEQIGKNLKGKNADEIVDDLFGKGSKESEKAKKFIDKLFR